ncbi:hypothetical protein ASG82_17215 [Mycobacterium sp. Soil538]|nr:hypothetical protein ASG82_17215 [Mycobacterium sp. Soil538]
MSDDFTRSAAHDLVRYSQVWEDHCLLERALELGPGTEALVIGSAGDNVAALLLAEPDRVVAVDINPTQCALIALKLAALRELSTSDTAVLLGVAPGDVLAAYRQVAPALSTTAREFWNRHDDLLGAGLIGCGLLERYVGEFRDHWFLPLADPIGKLFECPDLNAQLEVFTCEIYSPALESAFRTYFGAQMVGRGRDHSQYKYVDQDPGAHLWQGFRHAMTEIPAQGNFYLEWLLTGRFSDLSRGPLLLRPGAAERLSGLVDRVTIVCAELSEYLSACAPDTFAAAGMSDIFEYLDPKSSDELFIQLARAMRPGGRIAHWNLMVDRRAPAMLTKPLTELSAVLHAADRVFFYSDFIVDEVI